MACRPSAIVLIATMRPSFGRGPCRRPPSRPGRARRGSRSRRSSRRGIIAAAPAAGSSPSRAGSVVWLELGPTVGSPPGRMASSTANWRIRASDHAGNRRRYSSGSGDSPEPRPDHELLVDHVEDRLGIFAERRVSARMSSTVGRSPASQAVAARRGSRRRASGRPARRGIFAHDPPPSVA